jgi:hypothetical protein
LQLIAAWAFSTVIIQRKTKLCTFSEHHLSLLSARVGELDHKSYANYCPFWCTITK